MCDASRAGPKGCQRGDISLTGTDETSGSARSRSYYQVSTAVSKRSARQETPSSPVHYPKRAVSRAQSAMPILLQHRQDAADDLADSAVTTTPLASPSSPTTPSSRSSTATTTATSSKSEKEGEAETESSTSATSTTSRAVIAADTGTSTKPAEPTSSGPGAIEQLGNAYDSCEGTADCSQSLMDWASDNTWIAAVFGESPSVPEVSITGAETSPRPFGNRFRHMAVLAPKAETHKGDGARGAEV